MEDMTMTNFDFSEFGVFTEKRKAPSAKVDPVESFVESCKENIAAIKASETPTKKHWFTVDEKGAYTVVLKAGIRTLPLVGDSNQIVIPNSRKTIAFLNHVIGLAEEGKFADAFARAVVLTKESSAKARAKKEAKKAK
jgi:hypothetical protein